MIDLNLLRSLATLLAFLAFLLLLWRVCQRSAKTGHAQDAQLPFLDDKAQDHG